MTRRQLPAVVYRYWPDDFRGGYNPRLNEIWLNCTDDEYTAATLAHEYVHWAQYFDTPLGVGRLHKNGKTEIEMRLGLVARICTDDILEAVAYWVAFDIPVYYRGVHYG